MSTAKRIICFFFEHNLPKPTCVAPTMLEELCERIQHCYATLRRSRNKRNVELLTEKFDRFQTLRNNTQQHPITCNRVCKRTQHVTSNIVAYVCTGLDAHRQHSTSSTVEYQSLISFRRILSRLHFFRRLRHMLHNAFYCTKHF